MKVYEIRGRKIYKQWGMKFVDWCKINGFEYMIDEVDEDYLFDHYHIKLESLTQGFDKSIRWVCSKNPDHIMNFKPVHRTNGHCPYCTGHFLSLTEHSAYIDLKEICDKEWDYERNTVSPKEITSACREKMWWICSVCGLSYESTPYHRKEGKGCPYCANLKIKTGYNDLFTKRPDLKDEWAFDLNDINPYKVPSGSDRKVWWRCKLGHEWLATITGRANMGLNCPYCSKSTSFPERVFVYYLSRVFTDILWRYKFNGFEYDIAMLDEKVLIEYNGLYWHSGDNVKERDRYKFNLAISSGYYFIVIEEVINLEEECFDIQSNYCRVRSTLKKKSSYTDRCRENETVLRVINLILELYGSSVRLGIDFVDIEQDFMEILNV